MHTTAEVRPLENLYTDVLNISEFIPFIEN